MARSEHESAREYYRQGLKLLESGDALKALDLLSRAHLLDANDPQIQSSFALALARARGQRDQALRLAHEALRRQFYEPRLYVNLAQIHICFGDPAAAVRALRRALAVDSSSGPARTLLRELGVRRRPVIPALGRSNPINRTLGRIRSRVRPATNPA